MGINFFFFISDTVSAIVLLMESNAIQCTL